MMTGSFHISLFEGHVMLIKYTCDSKIIANVMHTLPIPIYWQIDFTPGHVVVSHLHDTVEKFRTGVKFSAQVQQLG